MKKHAQLTTRILSLLLSACLLFTQSSMAWAQVTWSQQQVDDQTPDQIVEQQPAEEAPAAPTALGFDITAPTILHSPSITKGVAGTTQSVAAEILDNVKVESALLMYRSSTADFYSTINMSADVTESTWLATFDTNIEDSLVHYYIVAQDTDGNRVQKGSESNPLTMQLQRPERFAAAVPIEKDNRSNWLAIGIGVLAVIAIMGGTSGGGGDGIVQSDGDCCTVTFTAPNVTD